MEVDNCQYFLLTILKTQREAGRLDWKANSQRTLKSALHSRFSSVVVICAVEIQR